MFDRDKFLEANKRNKEENPFADLPDGFYTCELSNATLGKSKGSNREQFLMEWEVQDEDKGFKGKKTYQAIGLEHDAGYGILAMVLGQLGVRQEEFAEDPDKVSIKMIGTIALLQITKTKGNDGNEYTRHRVKKVIKSAFKDKELEEQTPVTSTNLQITQAPVEEQVVIKVGMRVKNTAKDKIGTIKDFNEQLLKVTLLYDDNTAELVGIDVLTPVMDAPIQQTPQTPQIINTELPRQTVATVEEIVEEIPIKQEIKFEEGMNVKGKYNNEVVTGPIYKIEGDIIKIRVGTKAYPCHKDTVELITDI